MSRHEIDVYLEGLDEPKRTTLTQMRDTILSVIPDAEECISYTMPAFRVRGKVVAGFAAFTTHLSYLPHSGFVFGNLEKELSGYTQTKGALHFPVDTPLPRALVAQLIDVRLRQAFGTGLEQRAR
jgi:uncharacterized protein YdhG (YjbR/CyaY superfamily)